MRSRKKVYDEDDNIGFDSTHELYFYWYLRTLVRANYVLNWRLGETMKLSDKVKYPFLDSKNKPNEMSLLKETHYTSDFRIEWNPAAKNIFYHIIGERPTRRCFFKAYKQNGKDVSTIDIKNPYNKQGVKTLFSIKQRWIYDKLGIYVQEVEFYPLFLQTFTPKRYTFTDSKDFIRNLDYNPTSFKDFINRAK